MINRYIPCAVKRLYQHVQEQDGTPPSSAAPGKNHSLKSPRSTPVILHQGELFDENASACYYQKHCPVSFSLSLHPEKVRGKAEMATQQTFSSERDLQARCLSLRARRCSRHTRKLHKTSVSANCGRTTGDSYFPPHCPDFLG